MYGTMYHDGYRYIISRERIEDNMAIPYAALAIQGISAGAQLLAGFSTMNRKNQLSEDYLMQGRIVMQESMRQAAVIEEDAEVFAQQQGLAYIGSGVELMGSALLFPAQTRSMAAAEAEAVRSRGRAYRDLYSRNADTAENEGRASMIGSLFKAASAFVPFLPTGLSKTTTTTAVDTATRGSASPFGSLGVI
jgi:hypothetical protein